MQMYEKMFGDQVFIKERGYEQLTNIVERMTTQSVSITNNIIRCDNRFPVQYAKMNREHYDLVPSDLVAGLKCDLRMEVIQNVGYMLYGKAEFFDVSTREEFTPFPALRAGYPKALMGGRFESNLLLPRNEYAAISCCVRSLKDGEPLRITGLVVLVKGDILKRVDPDSVGPIENLFRK
jgi:hypothetical protein